jgi:peptidoglycan hydrolase FlgJ
MDALSLPASTFAGNSASLEALGQKATSARNLAQIDKTAQEFEQMALTQLLSLMQTDTDMSDTMFGGGAAERAFQPFLTEEYGKGFASRGGIGIADAVRREMLQIQERARTSGGA